MIDPEVAFRNGVHIDTLYRLVRDSQSVALVPELVKQVLDEDMWREHFYEKTSETFKFDSFIEFVITHPPNGLGTSVEALGKLCIDDAKALELLDRAIENDNIFAGKIDSTVTKPKISSSKNVALKRLRKIAEVDQRVAELRIAVLEGRMTVNAAMVQAGLRKPRITIPKSVPDATAALRRLYTKEELVELSAILQAELSESVVQS